MTNFTKFELNNSELVFGGELTKTRWSDTDGSRGTDYWDSAEGRVIYSNE